MHLFSDIAPDGREAVISDTGRRVSYGDLRHDGEEAKLYFQSRALLLILCDNTIDTIRFYCSVMYADCVPLLLEAQIYINYLLEYNRLYRPKYIWGPISREKELALCGKICYRDEGHVLADTGSGAVPLHPELALLLTTSGSTGNPKVVRLSRKNIQENTKAIIEALQLEEYARGATTLPMNYTYGMAICNMHLQAGAALLATSRKVMDKQFLDFVRQEEITNIQGVPFVHEMLDRLGFYDNPPRKLTLVTMGGGKARPEFQEKLNSIFLARGIRFCALYGQTEGTTMLTRLPNDRKVNDVNCIGVACRGMKAWTDETTGELIFSGSSVCMGYAGKAEDLCREDENQGILHTGDIAKIDESGKIYLLGRLKRFIKMAGIRVNMDDVECLVSEYLKGTECACCGNDDDMHVYIAGLCDQDEVKKFIASRLHIGNVMISIRIIPEIMRNCNGKIDYQKMDREYENNNGGA